MIFSWIRKLRRKAPKTLEIPKEEESPKCELCNDTKWVPLKNNYYWVVLSPPGWENRLMGGLKHVPCPRCEPGKAVFSETELPLKNPKD